MSSVTTTAVISGAIETYIGPGAEVSGPDADGSYVVTCDMEESALRQIVDCLEATQAIERQRRALANGARSAIADNRDYLALTAPTNAQSVAQVKALTRQMSNLIRLVVPELLDT